MLAIDFASPCKELTNPPVPPNIAYFLDHGLRDAGRWFVPLILRLTPEVTPDDVRSVLTAVTNHHDALRLEIVERAGAWEQRIAPPREFGRLSVRPLPTGLAAGSPAERHAVTAILRQLVGGRVPFDLPVVAAYIAAGPGDRCYLAIAVHHIAVDDTSRHILMADIVDAFGQRLAGKEIELGPASMTWREWSQRCVSLATHPAVLNTRDYWLENCANATFEVVDHPITERPRAHDLARLSAPLPGPLTSELDGARSVMGMATEELLLATLGRTIARTVGEGVISVDLPGRGRSVLEPEADLHRTLGWFTPSTRWPCPARPTGTQVRPRC
jgi:phthiocerol/phenolphthiocerol synthesis type-I polyketide synthase E